MPNRSALAAATTDAYLLARTRGVRAALRTIARGVAGGYAREEMHVLVKPLDAIAPIAFPQRLRIEDLGPGSLPDLADLNRTRCDTRADQRFARNLEQRYHGFTAHENGTLAGYYWWIDAAAPGHGHLEQLGIELGSTDVYGFDFFLLEEYRGEGRAVEFLYGVETRLRDRGYDQLWGYVEGSNAPARWLYSSRGYQVARTLHRRRGAMR
jgi:GNAT superfamily N-acetyltransferase